MKYLLIFVAAFLATLSAGAQSGSVLHFYDKYKNMENVRDVRLQGWVLQLASRFSDEEAGAKLLRKISHLRVLIMDNGNLVTPRDYSRLIKGLKSEAFEELFDAKDGHEQINCHIREKGGSVTDVLIAVSSADSFILLSLEGRFQLRELRDLNFDIEGAEHFKKLPENRKTIPQA